MKKVLALILAAAMLLSCSVMASAEDSSVLRFDENGEFTILHLTDCQDDYPATDTMLQFINHVLDKYDPDLVVLGGDNCVEDHGNEVAAIEELVKPFVDHETYFTLVFGNHDREYGPIEEQINNNAKLLSYYQKAGGKYCLAYDAVESLSGVGNHNLPIFSSKNALKVAYNLYMFDSGTGGHFDANGNGGYDCVYEDQVKWFETVNSTYTLANGGTVIPSMVFQHIIVGEVMDALYKEKSEVAVSLDSKFVNGKEYDLTMADLSVIKDGFLLEAPCPGVEDSREFEAMVEQGVVATFSGHDHINTFTINYQGIDIVNTPGCTFHSYGQDYNRGARLITLHEGKTEYDSQVLLLAEEAMESDAINLNIFSKIFGIMINRILLAFFNLF